MKTGIELSLWGLAATFLSAGVPILLTVNSSVGKMVGIICVAIAFIIPTCFWIHSTFSADRTALNSSVGQAITQLASYTHALEETAGRIGVRNDARFLADGFIGLQQQSLAIEEDQQTGPERVRMAVLGHLPSHMRLSDLTEERARQLYHNWEPPHLIADYVRLVNRRSSALRRFLESGGIVREIYDKSKLSEYVKRGSTFHDLIQDPRDEIIERLRTLLNFIDKPNYYLCLLGDEHDRPGPHFLLKQSVGLVIDLRTAETEKHFTKSLDGLYTDSPIVMQGFEDKFRLTWRQMEKDAVREFLNDLILQAQGKSSSLSEA